MVMAAAFMIFAMQRAPAPGAPPPKPAPVVLDCALAMAQAANSLASLACLGEEQLKRGEAAAKGSPEQRRQFEDAVATYRKAELAASGGTMKAAALEMLARLYDAQHLNEPSEVERVLRALTAITPADLTVLFRLSKVQENQQEIEAAEATLLAARHLQPTAAEPNKMLAQFYARRVTEMSVAAQQVEAQLNPPPAGKPDKDDRFAVRTTSCGLQLMPHHGWD